MKNLSKHNLARYKAKVDELLKLKTIYHNKIRNENELMKNLKLN